MEQLIADVEFMNEVTGEIDYLMPTLTAYVTTQDDGIGSYEFWGMRGYDSSPYRAVSDDGIQIEDVEQFSEHEKQLIIDYIDNNFEELEKRFIALDYDTRANSF
jgi:hypothetical protein